MANRDRITSRRCTLRSRDLLMALALTTAAVQVRMLDGKVRSVAPDVAQLMAQRGNYVGHGTCKRVRRMTEIDLRRSNAHDPVYWSDRAMIRWHYAVTWRTVDLWDRILKRQRACAIGNS